MLTYKDTYRIPEWAVCYFANGDSDCLTDEQIEIADKWYKEHFPNGCVFDFGGDDNEAYFSNDPAFGERNKNALTNRGEPPFLACNVVDTDVHVDVDVNDFVAEMIALVEFSLEKRDDGYYLVDNQGVNLGGVCDYAYDDDQVPAIIDRLHIYWYDYVIFSLTETLDDMGIDDYNDDDWESLLTYVGKVPNKEYPMFDYLRVIVDPCKYVSGASLDKVYRILNNKN